MAVRNLNAIERQAVVTALRVAVHVYETERRTRAADGDPQLADQLGRQVDQVAALAAAIEQAADVFICI